MVRWFRWHCPPDTGFEVRALAVWGRARYLSVTEAPHNTDFHTWMGKKHFCFFETAETGNRTPNSGVKGSGANHYPRARPLQNVIHTYTYIAYSSTNYRLPIKKKNIYIFLVRSGRYDMVRTGSFLVRSGRYELVAFWYEVVGTNW